MEVQENTDNHHEDTRADMADIELRRRMLDTAEEIVEEMGGLSVSVDHVKMDEVIKRAGVSRSSAYRAWSGSRDFYLDLLCRLAGPSWQGTAAFDQETINLATSIVADNLSSLTTPEGRRRVVKEAVRQAANQNFLGVTESTQWKSYVALTATLISLPEGQRQKVEDALRSAESTFIERMTNFYADMALILGLKLREPYTSYEPLAAAGAAVVEGLGLRQILMPDVTHQTYVLEDDAGPEEWTLPAIGFLGVLDSLVEPDPDYDFEKAIATYMKRMAERK